MSTIDYNAIMSDRNIFNQTVYTPLSEALRLLEERQKDKVLVAKIEKLLDNDIPDLFKKINKYGVSERHLATPNYDTRWFLETTKSHGLIPVFSEYLEDKFTSNNIFKHSLGRLHLHDNKRDKKGNNIEEKITIIDFNKNNGKKLKEVVTLWDEPLVDFHRRLLNSCGYSKEDCVIFDASDWLERNGKIAQKYYEKSILFYVCHGILFENFLITGPESEFTRDVLLPAIEKVTKITGLKPLIVPISPIETEDDNHSTSYDKKIKQYINII